MKKPILIAALLGLLVVALPHKASSADAFVLKVKVTNIEESAGNMMLALYNSKESFENGKSEPFAYALKKAQAGEMDFEFKGLSAGTYGLKLFQDLNENGKLDTLVIIPVEPYGISNNPNLKRGPKFKDAEFEVSGNKTIEVVLK